MTIGFTGGRRGWYAAIFAIAGITALSGCEDGAKFNPFKPAEGGTKSAAKSKASGSGGKMVERDVEAPDVFQVTDEGLWDGRPSLGGVWVAHPGVKDPERVIIRNTANSKSVIGALFRREQANPGPALQVSSDAAAALEMLAGAPVKLSVIALRREEAPDPAAQAKSEADLDAPEAVEVSTLDPIAGAAAAIDEADVAAQTASGAAAKPAVAAKPAASAPKTKSALKKPYLQIGIFSVEQNANNAAKAMRKAGMVPEVLSQSSQGKKFWRVIVGPATSTSERDTLLKKIKGAGFGDAYPVTN